MDLRRLFDDRLHQARSKSIATLAILAVLNVAAWSWALVAFHDRPALIGSALLAYVFGLRHAFDADHIAAIDNTVRKLMQEGKMPFSIGFFFSLGHATVVVLATASIAATAAHMRDLTWLHAIGGIAGTIVSSTFLLAIAVANLFVMRQIWRGIRRMRKSDGLDPLDLRALDLRTPDHPQTVIARLCAPLFRTIRRSWHMYPVGFLFGLGFDTATEVGLLGISAAQAALGTSIWAILVFPALFTAGMALMDTLDSILMTHAYGWAFDRPIRKLWYNLTITALSISVAIFIGGTEALGLIAEQLQLIGPFWNFVGRLNASAAGFGGVICLLFAASFLISLAIYKAKGYDALEPT